MTTTKPKILLIGIGSVGTIVSYTLEHLGRAEVTAVARPETIDRLLNDGYKIDSCDYGQIESYIPTNVTLTSGEAYEKYGPFDYIVITTKNVPDVFPVVDMLEDCFDEEKTTVVLIENGIGIEIPIYKKYPKACVISGVTMINTTFYEDVIKHVSKDRIKFGPFINYNIDEQYQIDKCKDFVNMYSNENNDATFEPDVKTTRWKKLVYNTCVNTTCACLGLDSGRVDLFGGMDTIVRPAMLEVKAIAKTQGVEITDEHIEDMIRGEPGVYYPPSMLMDVINGNYVEYIVIISNVVKIGRKKGIDMPTLTVLNNMLKLIQYKTMEKNGRFVLPEKRPTKEDHYEIEFLN